MKKLTYILFVLMFSVIAKKEAYTMDFSKEELNTGQGAIVPPTNLSSACSIKEEDTIKKSSRRKKRNRKKKETNLRPTNISPLGKAEDGTSALSSFSSGDGSEETDSSKTYALSPQGNAWVWEVQDGHQRLVKNIISLEEFEKLDHQFAEINAVQFNPSTAQYIKDDEFQKSLEIHPQSPQFFSLIDGEGALFQGQVKDKIFPFLITAGVHNCVAVTLHGRSPGGRIFSALVHIARRNEITSMDQFLIPFSKFKEKQITLRSFYKSEALLTTFNYIRKKNLPVTSVYVNDAYHSVNDDANEMTITYHPKHFEKNINARDSMQAMLKLSVPFFVEKMRTCAIILNTKTGKILEVPDSLVLDARRIFEELRLEGLLKTKDIDETNAYAGIQLYNLSAKEK